VKLKPVHMATSGYSADSTIVKPINRFKQ
jgi:hypothetical protein